MEVRFLRRHKYGDCSSDGRVEDCGSFGHGFESHHSPVNELMEQWQMWSLRRTENPKELDRNQPAPHKRSDGEVGNALVCKTNIRQFEPDSGLKFMPLWGNWLDPVDLGSAVEIHMKVRILPGAQNIGVYLLSLIRSRKSKWSHVGSSPITPTLI